MSDVRWDMLNSYPNVGNALAQGMQYGAQMRQRADTRNALQAYATNPDDPKSVAGVIAADPALGMRVQADYRTRTEAAERKKLEAETTRRGLLLKGAQIIRQFNPTDKATWQQARSAAQQAGIPLDNVPANFDPNFVKQLITTADALEPEKMETITVDGIVLDKRTMQPIYESPYAIIRSGPGGIYAQDRVGLAGLRAGTAPKPGAVIDAPQGLPQGWSFEDEGGPSPGGSGGF
jgi:hypothetical protein